MSIVRAVAADRELVGLHQLQKVLRHLRIVGHLPQLRHLVQYHVLWELQSLASHERVGNSRGSSPRKAGAVIKGGSERLLELTIAVCLPGAYPSA
jgi:hypothetical protein